MPYDAAFYEAQRELSLRSARRIIPIVVEAVGPVSAVDVGCGVGTWLRALTEAGVTDVVGVEGEHVADVDLEVGRELLVPADLSSGAVSLPRTFDLALSLEVAEHLPEAAAAAFVASLTALAPFVLFSAAVPEQRGDHHVNEQWQDYWAAHFAAHDYVPVDLVRPLVWHDPEVAWWYAQNTLLYARRSERGRLPVEPCSTPLTVVHPAMLLEATARERHQTPRQLLRQLVAAVGASVRHPAEEAPRPGLRHTTLERFTPAAEPVER